MEIKKVIEIVEKVFECEVGTVNENTISADIENWDSLGQFQLIEYLDVNYDSITKKKPELATASSVKELYEMALKEL